MTVKEIVEKYLKDNGYDGLYSPYDECGCKIEHLFVCGAECTDCKAGYLKDCDLYWIITAEKPKTKELAELELKRRNK
jgi:hypothetical protein